MAGPLKRTFFSASLTKVQLGPFVPECSMQKLAASNVPCQIPKRKFKAHVFVATMVLTLDGISKIGAHVRSNICYLIRSREVSNLIFSSFVRHMF